MHEHYLFITQDGEYENGKRSSALSVVKDRLAKKTWPVFESTRFKTIVKKGDIIFFYIAGIKEKKGLVVYSAEIECVEKPTKDTIIDPHSFNNCFAIIKLKNISPTKEIVLKNCLIEGNLIDPNNKKWGAFLMGGVRKVTQEFASTYLLGHTSD
jgi:hypothetical protein